MEIVQSENSKELGTLAGKYAAGIINEAIKEKGFANIVLGTGASQFETLRQLLEEDVEWGKVNVFHLDEYIGIPISHPASFRRFLKERFLDKAGPFASVHMVNGETNPEDECKRLGEIIIDYSIDVTLAGFGENGHLAFNDPPADFETQKAFLVVDLDEDCRRQQLGEGWFKTFDEVPRQAISMSIHQIMKSKYIICSVPEKRKAKAVKDCLEKEISNLHPASILRRHPGCRIFLDLESASLLTGQVENG